METYQRLVLSGLIVTSSVATVFQANAQEAARPDATVNAADSTSMPGMAARSSDSPGLSPAELVAQNSPSGMRPSSSLSSGMNDDRYSIMPYTRNDYVGISFGGSEYDTDCGLIGACENPDFAGKIYTGGMINPYVGLEFGYLHMGRAERGGGHTLAHGLNLSAVGRLPLGSEFAAFAKGGLTYGRTETTADTASGLSTGDANGFGPSLGAGVSFDFSNNLTAVLEWERHRFKFSAGRDWVDAATVGLKYRF